jgi:glutamate N-acetyltransferase/amino-acid N-acetyltransferase
LPHDRIVAKINDLVAAQSPDGIAPAARAIMTTDTFPKGSAQSVDIGGRTVRIAGIAKGSGMIAPDMATMLVYVFTDAAIGQAPLQALLGEMTDRTFNCITVDSDTSTSDTLLLAATGASGVKVGRDTTAFRDALHSVMLDLAHQVVRDGEGATKFVEVAVSGAASNADAKTHGMAIANSPLIKTAIAGEDPNWGRVVMAIGKSGAAADRDLLTIRFGDLVVAENGWVSPHYDEAKAAADGQFASQFSDLESSLVALGSAVESLISGDQSISDRLSTLQADVTAVGDAWSALATTASDELGDCDLSA